MRRQSLGRNVFRGFVGAWTILLVGGAVRAQIPGLPGTTPPAKDTSEQAKSKGAVATTTEPITVKERVPDHVLRQFLAKFLPKYPGVGTSTSPLMMAS